MISTKNAIVISLIAILLSWSLFAAAAANDPGYGHRIYFRAAFHLMLPSGAVRFVDGYPRLDESIQQPQNHSTSLPVNEIVVAQILNTNTIRFTFEKPLRVKTRNGIGQIATVVFPFVDIKFTELAMKQFRWLRSLDGETVFIENPATTENIQSFEEVVEQTPSRTVERKLQLGQALPHLYVYDGELHLGYIDFETLQRKEAPPVQLNGVTIRKLLEFNRQRWSVKLEWKESTWLSIKSLQSYSTIESHDPKVAKVLAVRSYVEAAVERSSDYDYGVVETDQGRRAVIYKRYPNVVDVNFLFKIFSCESTFERSR